MQHKMNKKLLIVGGILAVLLIAGALFFNALSHRYQVVDDGRILDKWTGNVYYGGYKMYNVHHPGEGI